MTALTKPVTRTARLVRGVIHVTLHPDGRIEFRERGRRKSFALDLNALFARAVAAAVASERAERKRERQASAQLRRRK